MKLRRRDFGGVAAYIVPAILIAVGVYFYMQQKGNTPADKMRAQQQDPVAGARFYAKTAYDFTHMQNGANFDQIEQVVTAEDFAWFRDNYRTLHVDAFNIAGGLDPNVSEAIARRSVMSGLLNAGPHGSIDAEKKSEDSSTAIVTCSWSEDTGKYTRDVDLVLESGVWKVKGFAGMRQVAEGGAPPDDKFVGRKQLEAEQGAAATSSTTTAAASAPAAASTPDATQAAPAAPAQAPAPAPAATPAATPAGTPLPPGQFADPTPLS